jgi:hypothetical protein
MNEPKVWMQLPEDAGQIVSVRYRVDWEEGLLYRRTYDTSEISITIECAEIIGDGEFDPINGILPDHGEWMPA